MCKDLIVRNLGESGHPVDCAPDWAPRPSKDAPRGEGPVGASSPQAGGRSPKAPTEGAWAQKTWGARALAHQACHARFFSLRCAKLRRRVQLRFWPNGSEGRMCTRTEISQKLGWIHQTSSNTASFQRRQKRLDLKLATICEGTGDNSAEFSGSGFVTRVERT
ncbi:unnamed protein product [Durusdinium trenchii]|uniref:Uncharacterized protein n=1 Tax=Durusdinium trenchii TaxID=1381693 RepID=A0ABP0RPL3_9DINO